MAAKKQQKKQQAWKKRNAPDDYLQVARYVPPEGARPIEVAQGVGQVKHLKVFCSGSVLTVMLEVLCLLDILVKLPKTYRGTPYFAPGPRYDEAESILADPKLELSIPWGIWGEKRQHYFDALKARMQGQPAPKLKVPLKQKRQQRVKVREKEEAVLQSLHSNQLAAPVAPADSWNGPFGQVPEGCVIVVKDGVWVMGRPADVRRTIRGED